MLAMLELIIDFQVKVKHLDAERHQCQQKQATEIKRKKHKQMKMVMRLSGLGVKA